MSILLDEGPVEKAVRKQKGGAGKRSRSACHQVLQYSLVATVLLLGACYMLQSQYAELRWLLNQSADPSEKTTLQKGILLLQPLALGMRQRLTVEDSDSAELLEDSRLRPVVELEYVGDEGLGNFTDMAGVDAAALGEVASKVQFLQSKVIELRSKKNESQVEALEWLRAASRHRKLAIQWEKKSQNEEAKWQKRKDALESESLALEAKIAAEKKEALALSQQIAELANATKGGNAAILNLVADVQDAKPKWKRHPFDGLDADSNEDIHMSEVCGSWQQEYTKLQESLRADSKATGTQRFLTFSCDPKFQDCGGVGDILLGMVSTFLVSILTKRAFVVNWPYADSVFEPNAIDWRLSPDVKLKANRRLGRLGVYRPYKPQDIILLNLHDKVPKGKNTIQAGFEMLDVAGNILVNWNRGITTKLLTESGPWKDKLAEMGLKQPYAFGCLLRFLMRLKPEVRQMVEPYIKQLEAPKTSSICIHARAGDKFSWVDKANKTAVVEAQEQLMQGTEKLFNCATKLTDFWFPPSQKVVWLLTSSSSHLKQAAKEAYGDKIMTTDIEPLHNQLIGDDSLRVQAIQSSVAEWSLLSHCDLFVITESGFSKTAAFYAMKPMTIYMQSRNADGWPANRWVDKCEPDEPTKLAILGDTWRWSGI